MNDRDRTLDEQQERTVDEAPEQTLDDHQGALVDVERDPAAVARTHTLEREPTTDETADRETSSLISERQAVADVSETGRTMRQIEQHARWSEEIAERRQSAEQAQTQQAEKERAERDQRMQPETGVEVDERHLSNEPHLGH